MNAQSQWNTESQDSQSSSNATGLIHSVRYDKYEDHRAIFSIDTGSANVKVFEFLINKFVESEIKIDEIEIVNG
ncbi:MAG: hypothetical protein M3R25_14530 [Bacteroidota bacterium]|nr:hypothetical protein [Bacteroidota bacterium]